MMRVSLSLTGDPTLILRGVFMAKYIYSARYMYISVERYQYFSGIFVWRWCGFRRFLSPWQAIPPDPRRSFTTDGDSNYKETSGCHSSSSCLFVYLTNFTITTTDLPFVQTNSWLCDDHFNLNLYLLERFLIVSSLFWTNIANIYVYLTKMCMWETIYSSSSIKVFTWPKHTFLPYKLFMWHKIYFCAKPKNVCGQILMYIFLCVL